jgi:hypothetical protein
MVDRLQSVPLEKDRGFMKISRRIITSPFVVLFALVISPINSQTALANGTTTLSLNGVVLSTGTLPTSPVLIPVPSDNAIDATDAVRVSIIGLANNSVITITANNASIVSAVSSSISPVRSTDGLSSTSINVGTGSSADFYVFTRVTTLSSFTVSILGNSSTYYLRGIAGPAYNVTATIPTPGYISSFSKVSIRVTDVFGNPVANVTPVVSVINLIATTPLASNSEGLTESTITFPSTPGQSAIGISISATDVTGLPVAKKSLSSFIEVKDLLVELALEKTARATEKVELEKKITDAQTALAAANSQKQISENSLLTLQTTYNKYKVDSDAKFLKLQSQYDDLVKIKSALDAKYATLIKKYNALAKRYKQPTVRG